MDENQNVNKHSVGEIDEYLSGLDDAEILRIIMLIEQHRPDQAGLSSGDVYEIVIDKLLNGDRQWLKEQSFANCIKVTSWSVIQNEIKRKKDALSAVGNVELDDNFDIEDESNTYEIEVSAQKSKAAAQEIFGLFSEDAAITCILMQMLKDQKAKDIKSFCKLTETSYQSAKRKMKRTLAKHFPLGLSHWGIAE